MLIFFCGIPRSSETTAQIFFCTSVEGGTISSSSKTGGGSFLLSTLLFTLSGIFSICIIEDGTIYGGFVERIKSARAFFSISLSDTMYAASIFPPAGLSTAITVASFTSLNSRIIFSTSVSSILNPRTFT